MELQAQQRITGPAEQLQVVRMICPAFGLRHHMINREVPKLEELLAPVAHPQNGSSTLSPGLLLEITIRLMSPNGFCVG